MLKYYNKTIIKMEGVFLLKKIGFLLALALSMFNMVGCENKNDLQEVLKPVVLDESLTSNSENTTNNSVSEHKEDEKQEDKEEEKDTPVSNENTLTDGRIYYYESFSDTNYYISTKLPKENEQKLSFIIKSLKNLPDNDLLETVEHQEFTPLPMNLSINSVEFNEDLIEIDFNSNFTNELGSSGETSAIESLVKTIGYNFSVNKVIITFNNENYSSGHIVMDDGEWFSVNEKNSIELKSSKN